jgi:hypothetical protein
MHKEGVYAPFMFYLAVILCTYATNKRDFNEVAAS